jgi:glycosyltransferase involved in cell wall biosynthesis
MEWMTIQASDSTYVRMTVVVPTYNRCELLVRCIQALRNQSPPVGGYEVIVVDDGSSDDTAGVCLRIATEWPLLRYVRQTNRGPAAARNRGTQEARGNIVVFTDDDCVPPPEWLMRIWRWFEDVPELSGVGGLMLTPAHEWIPLSHHSDLAQPGEAGYSKFIGTNNAAYKRSALAEVGGFDETFLHVSVEDSELFMRLRQCGHKMTIDPTLWVYHPARLERLWPAVRGYLRFYRGYRALQERYPEAFDEIYGASAVGIAVKGLPWARRIERYLPGMVRHPWRATKFLAYIIISRTMVTALHLSKKWR